MMEHPSVFDFLETFGLEPVEEDADMGTYCYVKQSNNGLQELEISFSAIDESFQVILRSGGKEFVSICSEKAEFVKLWQDRSGSGVYAEFNIDEVKSKAVVTLEPNLHCRWWILRNLR
jgi:hypothetical protein